MRTTDDRGPGTFEALAAPLAALAVVLGVCFIVWLGVQIAHLIGGLS